MELINFIDDSEPPISGENLNKLQNNVKNAIEALYPIGSIYSNLVNSTSPATLLGFGTWERLKDTFIYALGDSGKAGDTGGSSSVKLTAKQIPTLSGTTNTDGAHTHKGVSIDGINVSYNNGVDGEGFGCPGTGGKAYSQLVAQNTDSTHKHSFSITNSSQTSVSIMPPYKKAYMWVRTA